MIKLVSIKQNWTRINTDEHGLELNCSFAKNKKNCLIRVNPFHSCPKNKSEK